jgi:hypothetical protein
LSDRRYTPRSEYRNWYKRKDWKQLASWQLKDEPLCQRCFIHGHVRAATVVHHVQPHRGDRAFFLDPSNLESLCKWHHDSEAQSEERRGYSVRVGDDGWPVDDKHPSVIGSVGHGFSIPRHIRPSSIPVTVVCGPPAAGKTTWCRQQCEREQGSFIIDLDDYREQLCNDRYSQDPGVMARAFQRRDEALRSLADRSTGQCYFIVMAPSSAERGAWRRALGPNASVQLIATDAAVCAERIDQDPSRISHRRALHAALRSFYRAFDSGAGGRGGHISTSPVSGAGGGPQTRKIAN